MNGSSVQDALRWMQVLRLERHRQAREAAQDGARGPGELLGLASLPQVGQAFQQCADGDLPLQARQRCSQAVMDALAKGHMLILLARNIQQFRIRELLRVRIRPYQGDEHHLALVDHLAMHGDILARPTWCGESHRSCVAQQFLDG